MENQINIKDVIDPMGLLAEPTSEEMKEWENSPHLSDNPYVLIGWLVNYRKNKLEEELSKVYSREDSSLESEVVATFNPLKSKN